MATSSFFVLIGYGCLLALPAFTNELYYKNTSTIGEAAEQNLKIAYYVCNISFILAWFIAVGSGSKPQTMDSEVFDDSDDEDGAGANDSDEQSTNAE